MISTALPDVLARIVSVKRDEVAALRPRMAELEKRAAAKRGTQRGFANRLREGAPAIIAEIKKASPSRGVLSEDFDAVRIAKAYAAGGAAAISVLTDEQFFQGSLGDLEKARAAAGDVPVLRKDFTIDETQVIEAAAHGADAILLIAACLTVAEMRRLRECAEGFGLDVLVEAHTADETAMAVDAGARVIGINNRDLHTFQVRLELSLELARLLPADVVRVAESGIFTREEVARLSEAGYHAFLVGESLMKSADPAVALRELKG